MSDPVSTKGAFDPGRDDGPHQPPSTGSPDPNRLTPSSDSEEPRRQFCTTHWSVVMAAGDESTGVAGDALAQISDAYWYPIFAFNRRLGADFDEARDLTQGLFAKLLENKALADIDAQGGRFRSYLMTAAKNLFLTERAKGQAAKRGGGVTHEPIKGSAAPTWKEGESRFLNEPFHEWTPEKVFERDWARSLLSQTLSRLTQSYDHEGKKEIFEALRPCLIGELKPADIQDKSESLGLTPENVRTLIYRMRRRYGSLLRDEIRRTLHSATDVEDELRRLLGAVGR